MRAGQEESPPAAPAQEPAPAQPPGGSTYILGRDLKQLLEGEPDAVVLTGDEMRRYLESTAAGEGGAARAATALECRIRGEIDGPIARMSLELVVRSDSDLPSPLPLGLADAALTDATVDGDPPLLSLRDGGLVLWIEGKGRHSARIDFLLPLGGAPDLPVIGTAIPEALVTTLELVLPRAATQVRLDPTAAVTLRPLGEGKQRIEAALGPRGRLDLRWLWVGAPPRELSPPVRAHSEVAATVEPGSIQLVTQLRLSVLRGAQQSWELRGLADERVLDIRAADGAELRWEPPRVENGERIVVVHFPAPVAGAQLAITSQLPWSGESVTLRGWSVAGALSHRGSLAVRSAPDLDVAPVRVANARAIDPMQLPATLRSRGEPMPVHAFTAFAQPFELGLRVLPRRAAAAVRTTALVSLEDGRAMLSLRWHFTVHGGKLTQISLLLPRPFEPSDVVAGDPVASVLLEEEAGRRIARVFLRGVPAEFELRMRATVPFATARDLVKLELPRPLDARSELSRLYLAADQSATIEPTSELAPSDEPLDESLARELPAMRRAVRGFETPALLDHVTVRLAALVSSIRYRSVARLLVRGDEVGVTQRLEFTVQGGRVAPLRLSVPEPVRESLRVTNAEPAGPIAADGELAVRVPAESADTPVIELRYRVPVPAVTPATPQNLAIPLVRALDGSCDRTDVAVTVAGLAPVQIEGDDWRPVPLPEADVPSATLAARHAGAADDVTLRIAAEPVAVRAQVVIERVLIETRMSEGGEWRTRARYLVASLAGGRLRVAEPEDGRVSRVRWDGTPVPVYASGEPGALELAIAGARPGRAILDIEAQGVSAARARPGRLRCTAPVPLGEVAMGEVLWHVTIPERLVLWSPPPGYNDENHLGPMAATPGRPPGPHSWLRAGPVQTAADLEAWLTGQGSVAADRFPHGRSYLFSRLASIEPLTLSLIGGPLLVLLSSGSVLLAGVLVVAVPLRGKPWIVLLLITAGLGAFVWQPNAGLECVRAAFLGVCLVVLAAGAQAWLVRSRRSRRTSPFPEPGALASGSSLRGAPGPRGGGPLAAAPASTTSARVSPQPSGAE